MVCESMPELRSVRPEDAIRALERAGGVTRRGKGSHANVKMPNGQIVTFSRGRGPIRIGLLKAMLRKAEISEGEFAELLKGR
jgi:predicted RNA binding protein YcfA (HicA-like mRNA interferase family)